MNEKFGGHSTSYNNGDPVKEKLRILYNHPITGQHRVTIVYSFNNTHPHAIENKLLRSPEFSS